MNNWTHLKNCVWSISTPLLRPIEPHWCEVVSLSMPRGAVRDFGSFIFCVFKKSTEGITGLRMYGCSVCACVTIIVTGTHPLHWLSTEKCNVGRAAPLAITKTLSFFGDRKQPCFTVVKLCHSPVGGVHYIETEKQGPIKCSHSLLWSADVWDSQLHCKFRLQNSPMSSVRGVNGRTVASDNRLGIRVADTFVATWACFEKLGMAGLPLCGFRTCTVTHSVIYSNHFPSKRKMNRKK